MPAEEFDPFVPVLCHQQPVSVIVQHASDLVPRVLLVLYVHYPDCMPALVFSQTSPATDAVNIVTLLIPQEQRHGRMLVQCTGRAEPGQVGVARIKWPGATAGAV